MSKRNLAVLGALVVAVGLVSVGVRTLRCRSACGAGSAVATSPGTQAGSAGNAPYANERERWLDEPTGRVIVDMDDDASPDEIARVAAEMARLDPGPTPASEILPLVDADAEPYQIRVTPRLDGDLERLAREIADEPGVEVAEVERRVAVPELSQPTAMTPPDGETPETDDGGGWRPNDPMYRYQWHLDQINMPTAWRRANGRGVVVAVIDTGVTAEDSGRFRRVTDLRDVRFVAGASFVSDGPPNDDHGHGTHVAGTIAQATNNRVGVAGIAMEASIMPIKVLDAGGSGSWASVAAGIRWAADHGARVINMSLGGPRPSEVIRQAVEHAHSKGVVVVAAAGNTGREPVEYPAGHDHVIAVGSVRFDRSLAWYSSRGRGLDLVAPGGDTRVDQNGDGVPDGVVQNTIVPGDPSRDDYLPWQGTSMACPHVAGVAALLVGRGVRDPAVVERMLTSSARKEGPDKERIAAGILDAAGAVKMTEGTGGTAKGILAMLMTLGLGLFLRRKQRLELAGLATPTVTAGLVAGGLALVPWLAFGGIGDVLSSTVGSGLSPMLAAPLADVPVIGSVTSLAAWSVLPALGAVVLLLGVKRMRGVLVGLAMGTAAALAGEALWPTFGPSTLGALTGLWLLVNAACALWLGRLLMVRPR